MIAAKWYDMIVGVDIHWVMVPTPAPTPTPLPHPFVGIIWDPWGLAINKAIAAVVTTVTDGTFTGPVMINGMPAASTGTNGTNKPIMPHFPTPPGVSWAMVPAGPKPPIPGRPASPDAPTPTPSNDAVLITGSKTVHISGTNACRLGDLVMSCGEPIRLPSSTIIAVPMGAPVLVGGPPALDFTAALMAAIRTSWVSDRLHALFAATPGSWASKAICFLTGHPVDIGSGMVLTDHVDFCLPGITPLRFQRAYSSRSTHNGPMGYGWSHNYDQYLTVDGQQLIYHASDGRDIFFRLDDAPKAINRTEGLVLWRAGNNILVSGRDEQVHEFEPSGSSQRSWHLSRIRDRWGNTVLLEYEVSGRLRKVFTSSGLDICFHYNLDGKLSYVDAPSPSGGHRRVQMCTFGYSSEGDLVEVVDAIGHVQRYHYKHHLLVQETDRCGMSFYFAYDACDSDAKCVRTWGDGGVHDHVLTYDIAAQRTIVEDSLGNSRIYSLNDYGLVVAAINPKGGKVTYNWDQDYKLLTRTDETGHSTHWAYDVLGNRITETDPEGRKLQIPDPASSPSFQEDRSGSRWNLEYFEGQRTLRVTDPLDGVWMHGYLPNGRRSYVRNPSGYQLTYDYDSMGRLTSHTSWAGRTTRYDLDYWGRPVSKTNPSGAESEFHYDLLGRILSVSRQDGSSITCQYDPEGRLVAIRDASGQEATFVYELNGRLTRKSDSFGQIWQYRYDTEGRLVGVLNAKDEVWTFERDSLGRVIVETDFAGFSRTFQRDRAGVCSAIRSSNGEEVALERDTLGRVAKQIHSSGRVTIFEYDSHGRICRVQNPDANIRITRDKLGRVIRDESEDLWVESTFDPAGHLVRQRTTYDEVQFVRDPDGFCSSLQFAQGQRIDIGRGSSGRETTRRLSSGLKFQNFHDSRGRTARQCISGAGVFEPRFDRTYTRTSTNQISSIEEIRRIGPEVSIRQQAMEYDDAGHLVRWADNHGRVESYSYDATGNLVLLRCSPPGAPDRRVHFSYERGNLLRSAEDTEYEYDRSGFLVARRQVAGTAKGSSWDFEWRQGQLIAAVGPDGERWLYKYDGLGRRIEKKGPDVHERYQWDGDRICIIRTPTRRRTLVYNDDIDNRFTPIAMIEDGNLYDVLGDHLGAVTHILRQSGTTVWSGRPSVWGSGWDESSGDNPLRTMFPGQWFDDETGLGYSLYRYYDGMTGRFISPDPIGLLGGQNQYAYGPNPINWIDPYGLQTREEILQSALDVLKSYDDQIKQVFGPDVTYGIRGSTSTDTNYRTGEPFNPADFDIDAFVVNPSIRANNKFAQDAYPNAWEISELESEIKAALQEQPGFEGMRDEFGFKTFREEPEGATMCK
jgi:RHS repeat-associated protein